MQDWELAQLNIARMLAPIDSPLLSDFVSELDRINQLAEHSPGFIWRLVTDIRHSAVLDRLFGSDTIVNMSTWDSVESLHDFTYRTVHKDIMRQRNQWFAKMSDAHMVMWWVPRGHRPTVLEASQRLDLINAQGPHADAFNFKTAVAMPSSA